ncbi:Uncharacterised protein [[Clostridium] sordellii]|uniref:hypothetical protein n=1 Tax=Paraclostridium sordellii TaxID=1505 RepID=UPI0005E7F3A9|nr:hypothetical protein [Paeniclostridium sordellii]CEQ10644.1 Uncharacterised protein [[Clostridium] sordellii] [Paeniclostridium sordellii]
MYLFIALISGVLILKYMFINYMNKEYKITNSEFKEIKSKTIKKPIYLVIILAVLLYLVINFKYKMCFLIIVIVVLIWEFVYGLTEIEKLNEDRYTLYYIGEEIISSILLVVIFLLNIRI